MVKNKNSTCQSDTPAPALDGYIYISPLSRICTIAMQGRYSSQFTDVEIETVSSRPALLCET